MDISGRPDNVRDEHLEFLDQLQRDHLVSDQDYATHRLAEYFRIPLRIAQAVFSYWQRTWGG